jgi:hypothetical protein
MTTDNFYFQDRLIQTSQIGGQQYSDTSPLVFPGLTIDVYRGLWANYTTWLASETYGQIYKITSDLSQT